MLKTRRLAAGLATLGALAAPASATATDLPSTGKEITYAIEVDGEGSYAYSAKDQRPDGWDGHDVKVAFYYKGAIGDGIVFRNGTPVEFKGDDLPDGVAAGSWQQTSSDGNGPECLSNDVDPAKGWMRFVDKADLPDELPDLDGELHLWLRPFDAFDVGFDCPGVDQHPGVSLNTGLGEAMYDDGTPKFGDQPFDIAFTIPQDVIGMGYIEQLIPLKVFEGERCPHFVGAGEETCRLEWEAKIKFTKLSEKPIDVATPPPPTTTQQQTPPPAEVPKAPEPPKPVLEEEDWLVPLVPPAKASLSSSASKATFSVSCAAGCTGTASLTAGTGARASAAAKKPLARVSFKLAKGQTKRVTLKLGARARPAVKKAGGARIAVRTVAGGKATTKTTLKLRLPRRR